MSIMEKSQSIWSILQYLDLRTFVSKLLYQLFSCNTYYLLELETHREMDPLPAKMSFNMNVATQLDMEQIFRKIGLSSGITAYELIARKRFHKIGFKYCWVARLNGTHDIAYMQWMITPQENHLLENLPLLHKLQPNEALLENAFTFEEYRGLGIMPAVMREIAGKAKSMGYGKVSTYVEKNNAASLRGCPKAGCRTKKQYL